MAEYQQLDFLYVVFLIFCRVGTACMFVPAIGDPYVNSRLRLSLALTISVVMAFLLKPQFAPIPSQVMTVILAALAEITVGVFLGMLVRILLSAMQTTGGIIAYQSGLSVAQMFDPATGSQGMAFSGFLYLIAAMLFISLDLHYVFLQGLKESYNIFAPGSWLPMDGASDTIVRTAADIFLIGVKLAAPHMIAGLLIYLLIGIMGRLMPNMQVFFVMVPVQIWLGSALLMLMLSGMMMWYMDYVREQMIKVVLFAS